SNVPGPTPALRHLNNMDMAVGIAGLTSLPALLSGGVKGGHRQSARLVGREEGVDMGRFLKVLVASFVAVSLAAATAQAPTDVSMTQEEMDRAFNIYFNLCSGCHGPTR